MLKHSFETKVYHFDTDSYNIVWHGAYLKWFEIGRVETFSLIGEDLKKLTEQDLLFPVVDVSVRYKSPGRFGDLLMINTAVEECTKISIRFSHQVFNKETGALLVEAVTRVVVTNSQGKLLRKMPDFLLNRLSHFVG
jgi:acyl-CoA thioester hydrolase